MELVENYIASLDEPKKEWVALMVNFMREVFPDVKETLSNKIPTYKGDGYYMAFAAPKNYFTFHTDDMMGLSLLNELIPSASMGKSCAKIKYNNESAIEYMMDVCKEIVDYHKSLQSPTVSDMKALNKWSKIPHHVQQLLIGNVFCSKCGVTTIVDYGIHDDRFGIVLNGFCQKCGGKVARMVEDC